MEGASSDNLLNKFFKSDMIKLDRFDGTNFTRWKDKLLFLLMELGVAYLLVDNLPKIPEPSDGESDEIKASRKKREENEVRYSRFILNALPDRLYDLLRSLKSPQEIWKALENKYMSEKQGTDRFLTMKFFEFQMIDNKSVMNQMDKLLLLVSRLKDLGIEVSDQLQVGVVIAVIAKLPSTWNDYRKKLLHTSETFTIDQLTKHIRIEEETRIRENKFALEFGTKVNNIESSGTKKSGKGGNKSGNKRKHGEMSSRNSVNNKKDKSCFSCGKKGHVKKECKFYRKLKTEANVGQKKANVVEDSLPNNAEIVAMMVDFPSMW
ncbi:uncharacterized protein [Coffea arabica]|uniref:CCHC-type domain-containing protein n=1 Tax=Coffea arabica TaxID=13443 RepID=A0ABM4V3B2_COFAR